MLSGHVGRWSDCWRWWWSGGVLRDIATPRDTATELAPLAWATECPFEGGMRSDDPTKSGLTAPHHVANSVIVILTGGNLLVAVSMHELTLHICVINLARFHSAADGHLFAQIGCSQAIFAS